MIIETKRLILREMTMDDFDDLYEILSDSETMKHYPKPYDESGVRRWINWTLENYKTFGFGLFAVVLKENNKFIGDCGITMQIINRHIRPEIGYHINKNYHRRGYAKEASEAVLNFIFNNTTFNTIYTYMASTNIGSYSVALKNGFDFIEEYNDEDNIPHKVFAISKDKWRSIYDENK